MVVVRACCRLTPPPIHLCPQLADVVDSEALQLYMKPPAHEESKAPSKGFVVRDAPWTANSSEKVRCSSLLRVPWEGEHWQARLLRRDLLTEAVHSFPYRPLT